MQTLPQNLQSRLDRELDEGESINWTAQPLYRVMRRAARHNWLGAGIIVALFVAFFLLMAWISSITPERDRSDEPWMSIVGAGVSILIWFAVYPLYLMWAKSVANKTVYAITNKRAIILIVNKDGSTSERDYRGDELIHLARQENPDGTGTLTFESARGAGTTAQSASRHQFRAIDNVIEIERLLRTQFGDA